MASRIAPPAGRGLSLLERACAIAHTDDLDGAARELIKAVQVTTGWPVGYLINRSFPQGPALVSAWYTNDPPRFRVLRQVTLASGAAEDHPVVDQALITRMKASSTAVGEAAAAAGLGWVGSFPLAGEEASRISAAGWPRLAVVFLAEGPNGEEPYDRHHFDSVAIAVAQLGRIVERQETDHAQRALRLVMAGATQALVGIDAAGTVTHWNPEAEKLFGWTVAEAVGVTLEDLVVPHRWQASYRHNLISLTSGTLGPGAFSHAAPACPGGSAAFTATDRSGREFAMELTLWATPGATRPNQMAGVVRPPKRSSNALLAPPQAVAKGRRPDLEENATHELRAAIEAGQMLVMYQPIVHIGSGQVAGFEALVRWQHPVRGLVPPTEFIPLAEATGLIVPLGAHVLTEACRYAAAWQYQRPIRMSVNVSTHQLAVAHWPEQVAVTLAASGLAPNQLVLEITETAVMDDLDAVVGRLEELRRLGVRIAIDDFGTGHSSLAYLRTLPIDILKIDKSFIDGIALGPHESALARAVIKLASTLGLDAVAEGVSDHRQLVQLRRLHCPYGQGFWYSRPQPAAACEALLSAPSLPLLQVSGSGGLDGVDDGHPVATGTTGHGDKVVNPKQ